MADRYCISSGTFTDAAIWSATDDGAGGASVPTIYDDIYLNKSVAINAWPGYLYDNRNIVVGKNAVVVIEFVGAPFFCFPATGKQLSIEGQLTLTPNIGANVAAWGNSVVAIGKNALLDIGSNTLFLSVGGGRTAVLNNLGECRAQATIYAAADTDYGHIIGRTTAVRLYSSEPQSSETFHTVRFLERFDVDTLTIGPGIAAGAMSIVADFGEIDIRLETLDFYWTHYYADKNVTIKQGGTLELRGDILRTGLLTATTVDWLLGENASSVFVGTTDQTINMPTDVIGQIWTVDKPAGKLDLTSFNGSLQGRLRQLIVRTASNVDLAGVPPVLPTSTGSWNCYYGLKADSVSPEGPSTIAEHLQEAMDSCENYGLLTIPAGKTLCTKSFKNYTGAKISGTGTLCIRYGGLANTGIIDPTVNVRYFDQPALAILSAPSNVVANTLFSVDLTGSVGDWFRIDWDDGSFSETQTPGVLTHGYLEPNGIVVKTLHLTVGTDEGKMDFVTKTIAVHPNPQPEIPVIPRPVEIDPKKSLHGTPRGNLPHHYRYTLALGRRFMHDTLQLFCPMSESGRALANGSGLYLGRITHSDGQPPAPSEIASASYTVYRLDASDATVRTPMEGHTNVPLTVTEILLPELVVDENWPFDEIGYNFRHTPDDTMFSPFPVAGREYLVVYTLRPLDQPPKIIFQYRVHVV